MNDAIKESAKLNPSTTGEFEWILVPSREEWNCECAEYAAHGPYKADELPEIPAHPNCVCQIRPVLKKWEDFKKELLESDGNNLPDLDEWISGGANDLTDEMKEDIDWLSGEIAGGAGGNVTTISQEEKLLGIRQNKPMSPDEAVKDVNPNYRPPSPIPRFLMTAAEKKLDIEADKYRNNCTLCAAAVELRDRGFSVEAVGISKKIRKAGDRWGYELFENPQVKGSKMMFPGGDRFAKITASEAIQEMGAFPDGARFEVYIVWKGSRIGHTFNCKKINGKLCFYDAQDPSRNANDFLNRASNIGYCRVDDLELNPNIDWSLVVKSK
jgi:hypothetical protein